MKNISSRKEKIIQFIMTYTPWIAVILVIILITTATLDWDKWWSDARYQTTDNAYIKTDPTILKSRMTGFISEIKKEDYQFVKQGDIIASINNNEQLLNKEAAIAEFKKAQLQLNNLKEEIKASELNIETLHNRYEATVIDVAQAKRNPLLRKDLIRSGAITQQNYLDAQSDLQRLIKLQSAAKNEWEQAKQSLVLLKAQEEIRLTEKNIAQTRYQQTETELTYTRIEAPFDAQLNKIKVNLGSLVTPGTEIVTLTPLNHIYIIANLKETQIKKVLPEQSVSIKIDAFPNEIYQGKVRYIGAQSSGESALIPADNASGNFTKVVQRIPVYITFDSNNKLLAKLRAGMSVEVKIDTESLSTEDVDNDA
ncbi:HlyD family secretion protein [Proteus vulgaris]|uniref:HlyD family secretion protein n=1 Tax=Proteus vulgaris TaxID=585 RepID=UPI0018E45DE8|nr:HlyD family secretion protein [Proteus vulgaris]MBI6528260.1 HlyD family secretion protein [Proteus vulgaris]